MEIRRGNYKIFKFQRTSKATGQVITDTPEKMYFTVKDNAYKKDFLFQKTLKNGITYDQETNYYQIEILQNDTENLAFGTYEYDIKIINDKDKPKTLKVGTLEITDVVTHKVNEV